MIHEMHSFAFYFCHKRISRLFNFPILIIGLSFLLLFSTQVYSQSSIGIDLDISSGKMKDRAKHAAETGDVYSALFYYEEVVKRDSNDLNALYQLAEMLRYSRNYQKAEVIYDKVYEKDPIKYPFALYYKGLMQKMTGNYEEAKKNMTVFRKGMGRIADKTFVALLNKEIAGCDSGIVYTEFPDNVLIENAGNSVNFPHIEFSPVLLDSTTMLFGSLRMDSLQFFNKKEDQFDKPPVRQIYQAEKSNGKWKETGIYEVFNDPDMDMGNFVYSQHSKKYYFSKCTKDVKGHTTCKIYSIEKNQYNEWKSPELLSDPINMDGYSSTQPAIMLDTITPIVPTTKVKTKGRNTKKPAKNQQAKGPTIIEYLYFVSDRPDGRGGLDIWYASYNNSRKTWNKPINFGPANTPGNEYTPFYHIPSQTFYYSTDGHATAGGLDVFKITREDRKYSKPFNLSFPINSPQDDLGFTLNEEGNKGLLVSNRPGGTPYFHETCCDDIYTFEILPVKPFICNLQITLVFPDTNGCAPDQIMDFISYNNRGEMVKQEKINVPACIYEMPLEKEHIYKFSINKPGYVLDTLTVATRDMCSAELIQKKLSMNKIKTETLINETPQEGKTFVLKDIQYEFDRPDLTPVAKVVIDTILIPLLKEFPNNKLIISSHTDDHGSHKYNNKLSQARAESVVKYLMFKGVDSSRLIAKGYGETKPIMPNKNPDGTDNPLGRAMNRRTEFLLLNENDKGK